MSHFENGLPMFLKLDKNEVRMKTYHVREEQISKARCKKYAEKKTSNFSFEQ